MIIIIIKNAQKIGNIRNVQKSILILVLLGNLRQLCSRVRHRVVVDKEEDGLLGAQRGHVLADLHQECSHRHVFRHEKPDPNRNKP